MCALRIEKKLYIPFNFVSPRESLFFSVFHQWIPSPLNFPQIWLKNTTFKEPCMNLSIYCEIYFQIFETYTFSQHCCSRHGSSKSKNLIIFMLMIVMDTWMIKWLLLYNHQWHKIFSFFPHNHQQIVEWKKKDLILWFTL